MKLAKLSKALAALFVGPIANLLGKALGQALTPEQHESIAVIIEMLVTGIGVAYGVYLAPKNKD